VRNPFIAVYCLTLYVYCTIIILVQMYSGKFENFPLTVNYMASFNPDNCGVRLIPSTAIDNWIRKISSSDPELAKRLHVSSASLYESSISPTEEQFLSVLGNEDIVFTD